MYVDNTTPEEEPQEEVKEQEDTSSEETSQEQEAAPEEAEEATPEAEAEPAAEEPAAEEAPAEEPAAEAAAPTVDDQGRELHTATCADCGQKTQVPFKPDESKPVYCRDCYQKRRPPRPSYGGGRGGGRGGGGFGGPRQMHSAVCADCGQQTQVPFKPSGERPVYCRDCYQKHR